MLRRSGGHSAGEGAAAIMILGFGACGRVVFQLLSEPGRTSRCLDDPARLTCILHEVFAALPLGMADAPVTRSLRHHRLALDAIQIARVGSQRNWHEA